jgi:hypothetical protein
MADVTISDLTPGIPTGNALIPYSQGGNTNSTLASNLTAGILNSVIKQIQYNSYDNLFSTNSTTIQEVAGFNISITPTRASSKIIIYVSSWGGSSAGGGTNADATYTGLLGYVYRYTAASGNVQLPLNPNNRQTNNKCHLVFSGSTQYDIGAATVMMVDEPNTTSQVTYKIFARAEQSGYLGTINCSVNGATGPLARSWIYAVEF